MVLPSMAVDRLIWSPPGSFKWNGMYSALLPYIPDCCRVLGKDNANLGKIVAVMAKCLSKGKAGKDGLVDEATWHKTLVLLQQMNSSLPPQVPIHSSAAAGYCLR